MTLAVLVALLGMGTAWSAATRVDLVVKSRGRIRPITRPRTVLSEVTGEGVASSAGGKVVEVNFTLGMQVRKGDLLFRLDTQRLENEIQKVRRDLVSRGEEIEALQRLQRLRSEENEAARVKMRAEIAWAESEREGDLRRAKLALEQARIEEGRNRALVETDVLPPAELEKAVAKRKDAEERLALVGARHQEALRRQLELQGKEYLSRREELSLRGSVKRAEQAAAEKDLANLERDRDNSRVHAHTDGVVVYGELNVGDYVQPGKSLLGIAQQRGFRIDIAVPSSDVGAVRPGMKARVKLDAFDFQRYGTLEGTVTSVSPDSLVQDGRIIYVVKIRLHGSEVGRGVYRGSVMHGMTGQVEILTGQESLLGIWTRRIDRAISVD